MAKKQKKQREKSTFWKDFKAFISRGNVVDLAVAVVVGAAFTAIVNSLVNDIIKPLIAVLVGGDFSELIVVLRAEKLNEAGEVVREAITLNYGNLLMAILTFLIDAFVIFTVLRIVRRAQKRLKERTEQFKEFLKEELRKDEGKEAAAAQAEPSASVSVAAQASPVAAVPAASAPAQAASAEQVSVAEPAPSKPTMEELLAEIRDLLKESTKNTAREEKKD